MSDKTSMDSVFMDLNEEFSIISAFQFIQNISTTYAGSVKSHLGFVVSVLFTHPQSCLHLCSFCPLQSVCADCSVSCLTVSTEGAHFATACGDEY